MARRSVRIGVGAVSSVTAVEAEDRTRVVFNLVKPVAHVSSIDEGGITLTIDSPVSKIASASNTGAPPKTTQFAVATRPGRHSLKNIDFRRGPAGDAKVIIDLSDPNLGINIYEQSGEIMVDFLDTHVAADMQRRLDVVDFATPIQTIDTFAQGSGVRMVIKPKGKYEHLAYQAGNQFTINVKPVIINKEDEEKKKVDEFGYSGEKLSLNFQSIEVRAALQVIADFTGLNFVTSDTVKGDLTLRLKDVPWDQALDIIVTSKNLAIRRKGNVVTVAPADEVAAREKLALEATKQVLELEPLVSELIQINYAKAEQIATLLKSIKAVSGSVPSDQGAFSSVSVSKVETESNTLLSPRGQVTVDARTNSLLIQDTPGKLREVRKLIAQLDQPVRQVMIEARLVEASDNFSRSLGAKFGTSNVQTSGGLQVTQGSTIDAAGAVVNGLNVNLPSGSVVAGVSPGSIGLTIARLGTASLLSLELSALEAEGRGKIISSPRLITANQKKASIQQGQEQVIPLGFGKSETKKAVLGLDVTPQITPDDRVIMDVNITKDNFVDAGTARMNTKQIQTQVLLDNGETVVIGGIYEQDELRSTSKIPFFGDLPLLGHLFKNKSVRDNKTELLIFLTPRILSPSLALR
jgi:type IV pilus assembly protein PilQ